MATTLGYPKSTFHWACLTCKQLWEIKSHPPSKPCQKEKPMSHLPSQKEKNLTPLGACFIPPSILYHFLPRLMATVESMSVHRDVTIQTKELSKEPLETTRSSSMMGVITQICNIQEWIPTKLTFLKTCYRNESKLVFGFVPQFNTYIISHAQNLAKHQLISPIVPHSHCFHNLCHLKSSRTQVTCMFRRVVQTYAGGTYLFILLLISEGVHPWFVCFFFPPEGAIWLAHHQKN